MRTAILTIGALVLAGLAVGGCNREPRLDAAITADVERSLADDRVAGAIGVATINGVVTLTGTVPNADSRDDAEDAAEEVAGVKQVVNNLRTTAAGDAPIAPPAAGVDPNAPSAPSIR